MVTESVAHIASVPVSGYIHRCHLRHSQTVFIAGKEELESSHPTHVQSFHYINLASQNNLAPAVRLGLIRSPRIGRGALPRTLYGCSQTHSHQQGVRTFGTFLERTYVASYAEEPAMAVIAERITPCGGSSGISQLCQTF